MPSSIRRNSYYHDPALGAAFDDLAKAFAPPKATDMYAYAHAASERQKADRLSSMFAYARDPDYNRETADRLGVMGGLFNPNQSYYSVDQNNTTDLKKNAATVQGTLDKAKIDNEGELARLYAKPIIVGENQTVRLPTQTAAATGLPGMFAGQTSVNQGETIRPADGSGPILGQPKPLNESEWKAAQADALRKNGTIDDPMMQAIVMGNTPLEVVQTPEGARNVTRPQAIGQAPVLDEAKTAKPQVANYKLPDMQGKPGMAGTAILKDGAWFDSQTGEKLPAGAVTYSATLTGDKTSTGLGPTTSNTTDANKRAAENQKTRELLTRYKELIGQNPGVVGVVGAVRGLTQDAIQSAREAAEAFTANPQKFDEMLKQAESAAGQSGFDPNIARAQFMQRVLAYRLSKSQDPSGEVNVREMEGNLSALGHGLGANQKNVLPKILEFEQLLDSEGRSIDTLRNPQPVGGAAPASKPQAAATATSNGPPQTAVDYLRSNPALAAEFDTKYGTGSAARILGGQ